MRNLRVWVLTQGCNCTAGANAPRSLQEILYQCLDMSQFQSHPSASPSPAQGHQGLAAAQPG